MASLGVGSSTTEVIPFFSGNPFVEKTQGLLHIYKLNPSEMIRSINSKTLCILSVPAVLSSHDLLQFLAPFGNYWNKWKEKFHLYIKLLRQLGNGKRCLKNVDNLQQFEIVAGGHSQRSARDMQLIVSNINFFAAQSGWSRSLLPCREV
uniref:Uncharacterized protein n=1 Tax=Romanomermis culicivorax TaxID=13658 RepID=A0A915KYW4_ROMCU